MEKEKVLSILRDYDFYSSVSANHGARGFLPVHFYDENHIGITLDWDKETFIVCFNTHIWGTWQYQELHFSRLGSRAFDAAIRRAEYLKRACDNKIKRLEDNP